MPRSDALVRRTVLVANPSPDVYGSDLQMLESVTAIVRAGGRVVVALPNDGPLVAMVRERGADVEFVDFPVLRRANQSAGAFAGLLLDAVRSIPRLVGYLRRSRTDLVYVNTVTLPWWLVAARLSGVPVLCHVHEAENADSELVRRALVAPLRMADAVLIISRSAMNAMVTVAPGLAERAHLVYNGVPEPPEPPGPASTNGPTRAIVVGRLSPRKAPHLALEAVAQLRRLGYDIEVELAGSVYPGYEWYLHELEQRAAEPDLRGAVDFAGYCKPIWSHLALADLVIAPSLREPFGNAVVEAQLALRPVVATAALGHLESIGDEETGLLVPAGDVEAMAKAVARLIDEPGLAAGIAGRARRSAAERFSASRYEREVVQVLSGLVEGTS